MRHSFHEYRLSYDEWVDEVEIPRVSRGTRSSASHEEDGLQHHHSPIRQYCFVWQLTQNHCNVQSVNHCHTATILVNPRAPILKTERLRIKVKVLKDNVTSQKPTTYNYLAILCAILTQATKQSVYSIRISISRIGKLASHKPKTLPYKQIIALWLYHIKPGSWSQKSQPWLLDSLIPWS